MKAILISIQPQFVKKILNSEKIVEIRKTMPKCDLPIDVYIYCTNGENKGLYLGSPNGKRWSWTLLTFTVYGSKNIKPHGKVIAKFTLKEVAELDMQSAMYQDYPLRQKACLTPIELRNYVLGNTDDWTRTGYAWHIDNLEIFDEPMELHNFYKPDSGSYECVSRQCMCPDLSCRVWVKDSLTRPPQSWQYVECVNE